MLSFSNEIVENHGGLKKLILRDKVPSLIFYEVYKDTPSADIENLFTSLESDEVFYKIDISTISAEGVAYFCQLPDFYCEKMGLPAGSLETLPYIGAFVVCMGYLARISSVSEIPAFIKRARKEKMEIKDLCDKYRNSVLDLQFPSPSVEEGNSEAMPKQTPVG